MAIVLQATVRAVACCVGDMFSQSYAVTPGRSTNGTFVNKQRLENGVGMKQPVKVAATRSSPSRTEKMRQEVHFAQERCNLGMHKYRWGVVAMHDMGHVHSWVRGLVPDNALQLKFMLPVAWVHFNNI
eukprot:530411-Amphidinium_carterae.2